MIEDGQGEITDSNNVTTDMCSLAPSSQRENQNAIFASEKLENLDDLVNAVKNMKINDVGYQLNTATASDSQVKFVINTYKITYTSNGDNHQKLLSTT